MSITNSLSLSHRILFLNALAFRVCFACWILNGVMITYLVTACLIWMHLTMTKMMNEKQPVFPKKWTEKIMPI
ncbi:MULTISPECIES: hypothetical protein [Flavobacterium]|uniref:hypothetical protein n=1 Tax=Flavobacterium TaxID=237 RepID=UPI00188BA1E3|nr:MULTISPECIES: hypothetical protein [Flavobacterium]MBF4469788.1 hypothetical protein [Flavobacterium sp. HJJ]